MHHKNKAMTTSLKELQKRLKKEELVLKANRKTIDNNNKEVQLIISNANINLDETQLAPITQWLQEMINWEQESLRVRTIRAYAQFHNGRISGMQLAIDLINTIIKNNKKRNHEQK